MTGPALEMADAMITSGCSGLTLAKLLAERFPDARRADVYLAAAIAITDLEVDLVVAAAEIQELKRQVAAWQRGRLPEALAA